MNELVPPNVNKEKMQKQIEDGLKQIKGVTLASISGSFDKTSKLKVDWHFDNTKLDPLLRSFYDCSSRKNKTIDFVPSNAAGYQWSTCYEFEKFYDQMIDELFKRRVKVNKDVTKEEIIAEIESKLNFSIKDDLLPALGREFGGFLDNINVSGVFPLPELVLFLEIRSEEKASKIINALLDMQPLFIPEKETHGEKTINYITVPMVSNLNPGYCIYDNYILIGTSRKLLKDAIDVAQGRIGSIKENAKLQSINAGLDGKINSLLYLDIGNSVVKIKSVVDWISQFTAMQDAKKEAFRSGSEKRLEDVRESLKIRYAELDVLKEEYNMLKEGKDVVGVETQEEEAVSAQTATKEEKYEEDIKIKELEIVQLKGSERELKKILGSYDKNKSISARQQKEIIEIAIKPLLDAFTSLKVVASKILFSKNIIENFFYWELH